MTAAAATTDTASQDFRVSIANPPGTGAYPIAPYTWLLLPDGIENKNERNALTQFVRWALTAGQNRCSAMGYAPLPAEVAKGTFDYFDSTDYRR